MVSTKNSKDIDSEKRLGSKETGLTYRARSNSEAQEAHRRIAANGHVAHTNEANGGHHDHSSKAPLYHQTTSISGLPRQIRLPPPFVRSGTPTSHVPYISLKPEQFDRPMTWEQFLDKIPIVSTLLRLTQENPDGTSSFSGFDVDTIKFIGICLLWYMCSAVASNAGKQLLIHYKFPVTVSWVQFAFIAVYCWIWSQWSIATASLNSGGKRKKGFSHGAGLMPASWDVAVVVIPLCGFQIGTQVLTSIAISRVPVSFVHTVKALSPLFTVFAYRIIYSVDYSPRVYRALIPLTLGVMSVCAKDFHVHMLGLLCALGSCIIYVAQNIFSKRVLFKDEGVGSRPRMDKMNLLFWSAMGAFVVLAPGWLYSEGLYLLSQGSTNASRSEGSTLIDTSNTLTTLEISFYLWLNGTAHFLQALLAITVLATSSPVTYSVASLMKRVVVISVAVVWFKQSIGMLQGLGVLCTFWGLWLYDRAKGDVQRGERTVAKWLAEGQGFVLPFSRRRSHFN